uniref:CRAL-TRIO domain-containing protein n=1 Tax=Amphora coffeiformis TaxID=265554 RepID=A0A7S3P7W7_9STRA
MFSPTKSPTKSKLSIKAILKDHGVSPSPRSPSKSSRSSEIPSILSINLAAPLSPPKSPTKLMKYVRGEKEVYNDMLEILGEGPMRFGPVRPPLVVKDTLRKPSDLEAYIHLKVAVEKNGLEEKFAENEIFRAALYHNFNVEKTIKLLKRMDPLYWNISVTQLERQLQTQTLFPLPRKLTSKDKKIKSFFYMKPSRFVPSEMHTSSIIVNLLYVMDSLDRSEDGKRQKIGFIANMNEWTADNFTIDYCRLFMEALQGKRGPVHVDLFLIVNPPTWFEKIWTIMKPMLSSGFRNKIHRIDERELGEHLGSGFQQYLPDELVSGNMDAAEAVEDFIRYRQFVEDELFRDERRPSKKTAHLVRPKRHESSSSHRTRSSSNTDLAALSLRHSKSEMPHHNWANARAAPKGSMCSQSDSLSRCGEEGSPPSLLRMNPNEQSLLDF